MNPAGRCPVGEEEFATAPGEDAADADDRGPGGEDRSHLGRLVDDQLGGADEPGQTALGVPRPTEAELG